MVKSFEQMVHFSASLSFAHMMIPGGFTFPSPPFSSDAYKERYDECGESEGEYEPERRCELEDEASGFPKESTELGTLASLAGSLLIT